MSLPRCLFKRITFFIILSYSLGYTHRSSSLFAAPVAIVGWPILEVDRHTPPSWLGDEPVLGRLICPPVSRLNLSKKSSEGLIFHKVTASKQKSGLTWTYYMRSGIYWWNGEAVTPHDLKHFIDKQISSVIKDKGAGLWEIPSYYLTTNSSSVSITWKKEPVFGPYFLNGVSLWRRNPAAPKNSDLRQFTYECAGIYRPIVKDDGILLEPTKGYRVYRRSLFFADSKEAVKSQPKSQSLTFEMPDSFSTDPAKRPPDKKAYCPNPVNTPFVTAISWNLEQKQLRDTRFRYILTSLTPRGSLLRAGAGFAGELQSSLIPRNHPGYQPKVLVRPFDLEASSKELTKLGYIRPQGDKVRLDLSKAPLKLNLISNRETPDLLEKVLADTYMAVGINVQYLSNKSPSKSQVDGVVTGIYLPWPEMNFLGHFHSSQKSQFPFWNTGTKKLDRELEEYAISLTKAKPDFNKLQNIHTQLYSLEPVTVIMQHKTCLHIASKEKLKHIDVRDPDWFRKIIL